MEICVVKMSGKHQSSRSAVFILTEDFGKLFLLARKQVSYIRESLSNEIKIVLV